jgi:hypothetical protein
MKYFRIITNTSAEYICGYEGDLHKELNNKDNNFVTFEECYLLVSVNPENNQILGLNHTVKNPIFKLLPSHFKDPKLNMFSVSKRMTIQKNMILLVNELEGNSIEEHIYEGTV